MKPLIVLLGLLSSPTLPALDVIPLPASHRMAEGTFTLEAVPDIEYPQELLREARHLEEALNQRFPDAAESSGAPPPPLSLDLRKDGASESYTLAITHEGIRISGGDAAGVFYGIQTLLQLIPLEGPATLPRCTIDDRPRFGWRGMHLDVGRHMFELEDIKKLIDWMALHKMNIFHWHLTEDQGWRIEIEQYPRLTEIGAWRESTPTYEGKPDGKRYGGYYTKEQARELIAYAADRHITIIPEIDMPGHMSAAIAAYPRIGNDDIPDYHPTVQTTWGVHGYILSPKEETFTFVENILDEICDLFPSEYIHIGGDEAAKGQWKKSPFAQSVIQREGLKDERELQSYFIRRVEAMLKRRGRKLIGWDEIHEGGLSPNATVMQWRGMRHAVAAAKQGHDVVIAQNSYTYLNWYQHHIAIELQKSTGNLAQGRLGGLERTYSLDPIPEELRGTPHARHILGCQGQLWSEYLKTWDKLEYMAFPRFSAIAEIAWTPQGLRDYDAFLERLKPMIQRYENAGARYFDPFNPGELQTRGDASVRTNIAHPDSILPGYAIDGTERFTFESAGGLQAGAYLTVELKAPVQGEITALTGRMRRGELRDHLRQGVLETSVDGEVFQKAATFNRDGKASATAPEGTRFIRVRAAEPQTQRLILSEIFFEEAAL